MTLQAEIYAAQIEEWRRERERKLTADQGWLTVAGLFWLKEGPNTVGSDPGVDLVLPSGTAPRRVGMFGLHDGKTRFQASPGVTVLHEGKEVTVTDLLPDTQGPPDRIAIRGLTLHVIQRGARYAIRLTDNNSPYRRDFKGLRWFPPDPAWRVAARFVPYDPHKKIRMPNILGDTDEELSPGYAEFELQGERLRLEPVTSGGRLFFVLKDQTSGNETYPAGRFLYADPPQDGQVILDFNKAENPPCAFTPFATCPLPPRQNHLPVAIRAGELNYH